MSHRLTHIDATKAVASHLIVLHHFTAYGPLADALDLAAPRSTDWLFEYARMAVQVFLVIGGYFAASALASHGMMQGKHPGRKIVQRYVRLMPPLAAALVLTMVCSALARPWLAADFIPQAPTWGQLLAHLTLSFDVLGIEPLSIGIWYVAMDFQLFALMALLLWLAKARAQAVVAVAMLASLFVFNTASGNDHWAPYFLGAYAMGAFAWWTGHSSQARRRLGWLALAGATALMWDFRWRIAIALGLALWLGFARSALRLHATPTVLHPTAAKLVRWAGRSSYALFLTHFCVLMLANVVWAVAGWTSAAAALVLTSAAWLACAALALVFERWVERPLGALHGWGST